MADVYTVLFILLGILLSLPALLVALNLLLPRLTANIQLRLDRTPGRSFLLGVPTLSGLALFIAITANIPWGPVRALAWVAGLLAMGLGTLGAAGLARLLGDRVSRQSQPNSRLTHLVRGAVIYELACLFPIVGWFLFAPLAGTAAVGAAVFGLLGWAPRPEPAAVVGPVAGSGGQVPVNSR